jgi:D-alanyl-D-alanine carboxypeptidase
MRPFVLGIALASLALGCATGGGPPAGIMPRANLTAADYYPLAPGWKWAYDVEKDGVNILATYVVLEHSGDTTFVQAGDERLAYAVTANGVAQKEGDRVGDYVIKGPVQVGAEWPVEGGRARIASVTSDFKLDSGEHYLGCVIVEVTRTDPVRITRTTFAPDLGPVMLEMQVQDGQKFVTVTRARLRAVTRPTDTL